jgi:carbonic anhydrase/acetyltransferase-like protein (isoleucine patch superfamily)
MTQAIRTLGKFTPQLAARVFVDPSAVVSGQVFLADDVSVWPQASIRGDLLAIKIGVRTNIQDGTILHTTHASPYNPEGHALTIGADVTVGHGAILHGCTIQDFCLIGMGAIVLDGAMLESEVMLGAGSLVPPGKILKSGFLYFGNPSKQVRPLTLEEKEFLRYSARKYVELKAIHLDQ